MNGADGSQLHELGIAIIGMAGRFPGAASVHELWNNLIAGRETTTFLSRDELLAEGCDPAHVDDPAYVRARGILDRAEHFDAEFFGYSAREAERIDPQQ